MKPEEPIVDDSPAEAKFQELLIFLGQLYLTYAKELAQELNVINTTQKISLAVIENLTTELNKPQFFVHGIHLQINAMCHEVFADMTVKTTLLKIQLDTVMACLHVYTFADAELIEAGGSNQLNPAEALLKQGELMHKYQDLLKQPLVINGGDKLLNMKALYSYYTRLEVVATFSKSTDVTPTLFSNQNVLLILKINQLLLEHHKAELKAQPDVKNFIIGKRRR